MPEWADGTWWISWEEGKPIAFIGVEPVKSWHKSIYICRVGVVATHRGRGIQAFLMNKVVKAAEGMYERIISSTYENPASANSFIKCKFKTYLPQTAWGAAGTIYWIKELK
jgi:GNAT superfamily N-acetyltransferase